MKRVIIEVPDGWVPGECKMCSSYSICGLKEMGAECPLANAKEAFEKTSVEMCACVVAKDRGNPVKLFAVEDK